MRWVLIARANTAGLYEESDGGTRLLFECRRLPRETTQEFGRRVADDVSDVARVRAFDELEILASRSVLTPVRLALEPCCSRRLIAASNMLDLGSAPIAA